MATEIGKGVIPVTFDKNQIGRDLSSSFDSGAKQSEGSIGSTFRRLAGLATAAFAGVQVFGFVKDSIEQARESNKVAAQTEAVIKSTGGAANLAAKDFANLATSISLKTGIDDEQIQSAENLLATFTNIRNEVGLNNDIFSQSTKIAVDMGAALGGDASSNAILLGKALNDPVRGLTALTRVGVAFDDGQREQIKTMQEHGDILGAQKIILAELNKEFGGSAEATATAGAKWSVFWGNLQENIGNLLIPMLDAVATWAMTTLPNAFGTLQDAVGPVLSQMVLGFSALGAAFSGEGVTSDGWIGMMEQLGVVFRQVWDVAAQFFSTLTTGFTDDEGTSVEKFALILRNDLWPIMQTVANFMADHWQPTLVLLGVAVAALISPFLGVVAGLAAVSGGLLWAYKNVKGFRDVANSAGDVVLTIWHALEDHLGPAFLAIGSSLADLARFFADRWDKIRGSVVTVLNILKIAIAVFIAPILLAWTYFHDQILAVVQLVWNQVTNVVQTAVRIIGDIFDLVISILTGNWGDAWNDIKDIFGAAFDFLIGTFGNLLTFVVDFFSTLPGNILTALGDLAGVLVPKAFELIGGLLAGIVSAAVAVWDWYLNLPTVLLGYFVGAVSWLHDNGMDIIKGIVAGIVLAATDVWTWFQNLPTVLGSYFVTASTWLLQVGKDLIAGIIQGIRDAGPGIISALADQIPGVGLVHSGVTSGPDDPSKVIIGGPNAIGGIYDRKTFGMFGEAGREVILPLTNAQRTWQLAGQSGLWDVLAKGMPRRDIPGLASAISGVSSSSKGRGDGPLVAIENASFGNDRQTTERDLNWFALTKLGN